MVEAYVDSGSFYAIFEAKVAKRLGIHMEAGQHTQVTTGTGQEIRIYLHHVGLRIGEEHFTAIVAFSDELGIGFQLQGRHSIFDRLRFCFNDRDRVLEMTPLAEGNVKD